MNVGFELGQEWVRVDEVHKERLKETKYNEF